MTRDLDRRPWFDSLGRFVETLRRRGLMVSQAEMIDAARAAAEVGPEDRARLRSALSMTLAKDRHSQEILEEVFEVFFASPVRTGKGHGRGDRGAGIGVGGGGRSSGVGGSKLPSRSIDDAPPSPSAPRARSTQDHVSVRRGVRPLEAQDLRKALGVSGQARDPREASKEGTPAMRRGLDEPAKRGSRREGRREGLSRAEEFPPEGRPRLRKILAADRRSEAVRPGSDSGSVVGRDERFTITGPLTTDEERRLGDEIPRILRTLRFRRGRRARRSARGRIWMKRVIRENLASGGVPFRLPVHERAPRPASFVLLVDVSYSVARAAGLFLRIALDLLDLDRRTRVFLFVNHPVEGTEPLRSWVHGRRRMLSAHGREDPASGRETSPQVDATRWSARVEPRGRRSRPGAAVISSRTGRSFLEVLEEIPGLDPEAASDYGRAFYALSTGALRRLRGGSVLVVLGDGRTNVYDPLPWAFEEIAGRAKRVIWLIPEPRHRWGTGDSAIAKYLRSCDVAIEVSDLEGLAHGVREMIASL